MIRSFKYIPFIAVASFSTSCKKAFAPDVTSTSSNYLVVEGIINTGTDSTYIRLSRTTGLADTAKTRPEPRAEVYIEDDKNGKIALKEAANGVYKCAPFNTNHTEKCRLHIYTTGRKVYVSDFVSALNTPPVDSLTYSVLSTGIQFYTSTHDPANQTKYYRWDFDETWEYISLIRSNLIYENDSLRYRNPFKEDIRRCWVNTKSNAIVVASTADLNKSVINNQPIAYVDIATNKLWLGYSMLLKQYAISTDAYEYWQELKKNTEHLGGIFDAQPTGLTGNLHAVANVDEPVLGYISASNATKKRVFIEASKINLFQPTIYQPHGYFPPPFQEGCSVNILYLEPKETLKARMRNTFGQGNIVPTIPSVSDITHEINGWFIAPVECVDCRLKLKGGTNNQPSYWPTYL